MNSNSDPNRDYRGRVSATSREVNSVDEFFFWIEEDKPVGAFDFVTAELGEPSGPVAVGVITGIEHSTNAPSHIKSQETTRSESTEGSASSVEGSGPPRKRINVARVAMLLSDTPMPVAEGKKVRFATEDEIMKALGVDPSRKDQYFDAGYFERSDGKQFPVYLDPEFVLGPEGAHVNVNGRSGLATKTSYAMHLLHSILGDDKGQTSQGSVAAVLLNVKHTDLLHIDEPAVSGDERRAFHQVTYFKPYHLNQDQGDGAPNTNVKLFGYTLSDILSDSGSGETKLYRLFADVEGESGTMESICGHICSTREVYTEGDMSLQEVAKELEKNTEEGQEKAFGTRQPNSIGKFMRHLKDAVHEPTSTGLFGLKGNDRLGEGGKEHWVNVATEIGNLSAGDTYVVDVAALTVREQTFVFSDIVDKVLQQRSEASRGVRNSEVSGIPPEKIVLFVDELNKFAPDPGRSAMLKPLIEVSERGRSLGVVLFSAQQAASVTSGRVINNAATKVYGNMDAGELEDRYYNGIVEAGMRERLKKLRKGEMFIYHPTFVHPILVKFPKPGYRQP